MNLLPRQSSVRAVAIVLVMGGLVQAVELPAELVTGLQSEKFAERETAEAGLLAWGRQRADEAMDEFYRQSREAAEPEVRQRCHDVLRELVVDDYLRNGVGYLGVRMNPALEQVMVAGEAKPRFAIRLLQVEMDTPAKQAGLVAGDLLLGVNDRMWGANDQSEEATKVIKGFKAGAKVTISLFRDGKVVEIPVVLGRRPAFADVPMLLGFGEMPGPDAIKQAEEAAREEYFRRWLDRKHAESR